ncbi:hypothetical protein N7510_010138 [Penicillium lagena]|uniref:uncharacterized protein n=1 Tax=Penicillium lagena TaxID=94218 RepID=UPI002540855E|nr:uncharacterized protein N7510_010138 [Penicillium lagena]KAJ5604984.1 hypothetical protein N7510_010138 [Penicillium lagena]
MSVGGPCLWVPSLSSPITSNHLSAVTSHLPTASRDSDNPGSKTFSPRYPQSRKEETRIPTAEMQPAGSGFRAENALSVADITIPREAEIPSQYQRFKEGRVKLEMPRVNEQRLAIPQQLAGTSGLDGTMDGLEDLKEEEEDEDDNESTISPSDERGGDGVHKPSALDKKKMKRFRLTHNQTRFLMSEFTRQAHPDAAHRDRLSREIPGLTPRQVQVWFQNRRAKLKRLTTNDRERMLKSRALPDDFDTTKVLRTPFEGNSAGGTPVASPQTYGVPNPDFGGLRTLRTDCVPRPNEDEYLISPLSSASTAGTYMSSRTDLSQSSMIFSRPSASASMSELHRTIRTDYPAARSSSLSDAAAHPSPFHSSYQLHNRFSAAGAQAPGHPAIPYARRPMDYGMPRHPGGMPSAYDQPSFEGSVSPTDSQGAQAPYDMNNLGSQPQGYQAHLGMNPQVAPTARQLSTFPVSAAPDYGHFSYDPSSSSSAAGPMAGISYTQSNTSSLSLPGSFASSESVPATHDQLQTIDSLRSKFTNPSSFNYTNYLQQ